MRKAEAMVRWYNINVVLVMVSSLGISAVTVLISATDVFVESSIRLSHLACLWATMFVLSSMILERFASSWQDPPDWASVEVTGVVKQRYASCKSNMIKSCNTAILYIQGAVSFLYLVLVGFQAWIGGPYFVILLSTVIVAHYVFAMRAVRSISARIIVLNDAVFVAEGDWHRTINKGDVKKVYNMGESAWVVLNSGEKFQVLYPLCGRRQSREVFRALKGLED